MCAHGLFFPILNTMQLVCAIRAGNKEEKKEEQKRRDTRAEIKDTVVNEMYQNPMRQQEGDGTYAELGTGVVMNPVMARGNTAVDNDDDGTYEENSAASQHTTLANGAYAGNEPSRGGGEPTGASVSAGCALLDTLCASPACE